jgi:hypothetical protein
VSSAKLDPEVCRLLAAELGAHDGGLTPRSRQFSAVIAQLTAAAELGAHPVLTADEVRAAVREVFATVARLSGEPFAQRVVEDISTRVAKELAGSTVGLSAEELAVLQDFRDRAKRLRNIPVASDEELEQHYDVTIALLDRLLAGSPLDVAFGSAAGPITGQTAQRDLP